MKRNEKPFAVVVPTYQKIIWPDREAIIDASLSTGDENVSPLKYRWEILKTPSLDEREDPQAYDKLKLTELFPGVYVIRVTVEDANGK